MLPPSNQCYYVTPPLMIQLQKMVPFQSLVYCYITHHCPVSYFFFHTRDHLSHIISDNHNWSAVSQMPHSQFPTIRERKPAASSHKKNYSERSASCLGLLTAGKDLHIRMFSTSTEITSHPRISIITPITRLALIELLLSHIPQYGYFPRK